MPKFSQKYPAVLEKKLILLFLLFLVMAAILETTLLIFFIFIILKTYVPLIFHAKIQPKISSGSGEKIDFVIFAIFSNGCFKL